MDIHAKLYVAGVAVGVLTWRFENPGQWQGKLVDIATPSHKALQDRLRTELLENPDDTVYRLRTGAPTTQPDLWWETTLSVLERLRTEDSDFDFVVEGQVPDFEGLPAGSVG